MSVRRLRPGSVPQLPFEVALCNYEKQTGVNLIGHSLVRQLENCHSVESTTAFLQEQVEFIKMFRGDDGELKKSLRNVVNILHVLSTASSGEGISLVRWKTLSTHAS